MHKMHKDKNYRGICFILNEFYSADENLKKIYYPVLESAIQYLRKYKNRVVKNNNIINGFNLHKVFGIEVVLMCNETFRICHCSFENNKSLILK